MRKEYAMPSFVTHYLYGVESFQQTKNNALKAVIKKHKQVYCLGLQGPDLFLYDFLMALQTPFRGMGRKLHNDRTRDYIFTLVDHTMKLKHPKEKEIAMAYTAGFICHYLLDSNTHPFIYYHSGQKDITNPLHAFALHSQFETTLDANMYLYKTGDSITHFPFYKTIALKKDEAKITARLLKNTINETYFYHKPTLSTKRVLLSMKSMYLEIKQLQDPSGGKQKLFHAIDQVCPGYPILSSMISNGFLNPSKDMLNLQKKPWYSPWEPDVIYTKSYPELFHESLSLSKAVFDTLYTTDFTALHKLILNRSYNTGLLL